MKHPIETWKWFGNAGHFICSRWCQFHLCTQVGDYLISTVGQLWPERPSREIHAKVHDPAWLAKNIHRKGDDFDSAYMKKFGFETVGCDREFETTVFKAGAVCTAKDCKCGMPSIDGSELDFAAANDAGTATQNHYAMCLKWAEGKPKEDAA
jgi:hypothetical protein